MTNFRINKRRATPTIADDLQLNMLEQLGVEGELIEVPAPKESEPATFDYDAAIRQSLNTAITASPYTRDQIAKMLSSLVGKPISKPMLDTYTGKSRQNKLPAYLIPALTQILGDNLIKDIGEASGCVVLERQSAVYARLGQLMLIAQQVKDEQHATLNELPIFAGLTQ